MGLTVILAFVILNEIDDLQNIEHSETLHDEDDDDEATPSLPFELR